MEEISPAVAVAISLSNPIRDSSVAASHVEITRVKLMTESASLLSVPSPVIHVESLTSWDDTYDGLKSDLGSRDVTIQENEDDEILSVGDELNGRSLPIAVEFEGIGNGQIVAKVISLGEQSMETKMADVLLTVATTSKHEENSTLKASVMALQLPTEKNSVKGGIKSVFELDYVPLWGSVSLCGKRPEMEDAVAAIPQFTKIPIRMLIGDHVIDGVTQNLSHLTSHFFGVYDGHGGSQVANYCRDRIHFALAEELTVMKYNNNDNDSLGEEGTRDNRQLQWEKVFRSCFVKVDDEVSGKVGRDISEDSCNSISEPVAPETVGSTAVVALICSSHIIVANCGDSRAVLYRGKEAIALSIDHKPNREDEYARIEASGGKVIQWNGHRVFGVLAMSRSIGDRYFKPWIIPEPEVTFVARAREDECLILASDGLWDVMTNEEACEAARRRILHWHKKNVGVGAAAAAAAASNISSSVVEVERGVDPAAQAAADYLSTLALQKGSKDNISVIVVDLKAQRKFKTKSS